jgi:hypothetical protein
VLEYNAETNTAIVVTITARSLIAFATTTVVLIAHDAITFADHADNLAYGENMIITATCDTGAIPTLSADGVGKDIN